MKVCPFSRCFRRIASSSFCCRVCWKYLNAEDRDYARVLMGDVFYKRISKARFYALKREVLGRCDPALLGKRVDAE